MEQAPSADAAGGVLNAFLRLWLEDQAAGIRRSDEEYAARFPGFEAMIRGEIQLLREDPGRSASGAPPGTSESSTVLGRYRIVRELGRGGQAIVYLAEDLHLPRLVALKVLRKDRFLLSAQTLQRFLGEARAAARIEDSRICPVLEVGESDTAAFIAMRFVEGRTLSAAIGEARLRGETPASLDADVADARSTDSASDTAARGRLVALLAFFEAAARAAHIAHEAGVIHRDIKPGNIMVTPTGAPVLLDFGLAHDDSGSGEELTRTGDFLGTPAYMSPEQHRGERCDRRTDVWSLGVSFFEALTLERPFAGATRADLARAILGSEIPDPRARCRFVGAELCAVLETALERNPERRYATALELAEDLRRLREHVPVRARRAGPILRGVRWSQRHPGIAAALVTSMVAVTLLSTFVVKLEARNRSLQAWKDAMSAVTLTEDAPPSALAKAVAAARSDPQPEMHEILLQILDRCRVAYDVTIGVESKGAVLGIPTIDAVGRRIVLTTHGGELLAIRTRDGKLERRIPLGVPRALGALLPDGRRAFIAYDEGSGLVDIESDPKAPSGVLHWRNSGESRAVMICAVSPYGEKGAAGYVDGSVRVRDLAPPYAERTLVGHQARPVLLAFSPDAKQLAVLANAAGGDRRAVDGSTEFFVWDLESGRRRELARLPQKDVCWIAWAKDSQRLAFASHAGVAGVIDVFEDRLLWSTTRETSIPWVQFVSESTLVAGGLDEITIWDLTTNRLQARRAFGSDRSSYRGALSRDGSRLAVYFRDGIIRIFDTQNWNCVRVLERNDEHTDVIYWGDDDSKILTMEIEKYFRGWTAGYRSDLPEFTGLLEPVRNVAFAGRGQLVVAAGGSKVCVWQVASGAITASAELSATVERMSVGQNRALIITKMGAYQWRFDGHEPPQELTAPGGAIRDGAVLPRTGRVATACDDGTVCIYESDHAAPSTVLRHASPQSKPLTHLVVDAEERRIVACDAACFLHVWDIAEMKWIASADPLLESFRRLDNYKTNDLAVSRNGSDVYWSGQYCNVAAWKISGNHEILRSSATYGSAGVIGVDPTNQRLLVAHATYGDQVFLDARRLDAVALAAPLSRTTVTAAGFTEDGRLAFSASKDGTVRLWRLDPPRFQGLVRDRHGAVLSACFSPDAEWVLTGAKDGTVRMWPTDALAASETYLRELNRPLGGR